MRDRASSPISLFSFIIAIAVVAAPVYGVVTGVTGSARARVVQFGTLIPTQTDNNTINVPGTLPTPPAVAQAELETVEPDGQVTAGGRALAVFEPPNLTGIGVPNDVGFDLAAFTDDDDTTWLVEGSATERRTIVLDSAQAGTEIVTTSVERARSRVVLSGVMLITSLDPLRDLSGVQVDLEVNVTKFDDSPGPPSEELLAGAMTLGGGPLGEVSITEATGALQPVAPAVLDFSTLVINLPLVKAVIFAGVEVPYEYDYRPNQPFDLELVVRSRIRNIPGGTGGAAVFGLPQAGLGDVLARVKNDDRGDRLEAVIAEQVDTTGAAYVGQASMPFLFPACGALGVEAPLFVLAAVGIGRRRRRAIRPRR